uniref:Phospholipid scramblase n=1 Tax=Periophthalmus magnuspinnatus TaxID=409849 RepID=A0A3B4AMP4_9GOBI
MSAVTNQPHPFGHLEREKHIEMIFKTYQNRNGTSCECLVESVKTHDKSTCWESHEELSENKNEPKKLRHVGKRPAGVRGIDLSILDLVEQFHVNARPELQGPHCVPRRVYSISANSNRVDLLVAIEESSCLCLQCCGPARACSLKGIDSEGRQVFYFERPFRMDACCLGCCLMEMRVYTAQRQLIGIVCQRWSMFTPLLEVCDASGVATFRLQGPCCPCRCLSNQDFQIMSNTGDKIGTIWKKWPGFSLKQNMDHEYFGLNVPQNMESETKLMLLGATFLLVCLFLHFALHSKFII